MNEPTDRLDPRIDALREAYAALNGGDVAGFIRCFDADVLRVEFEGSPMGATYRGIEAVRTHFERARSTWAEGTCTPTRFVTAGDHAILQVYVRVRLKDKNEWLIGDVGDLFTFRNGKITLFRTFDAFQKALDWA